MSKSSDMKERYAFVLSYFDPVAELEKKYQLLYYTSDETISVLDIKNKRTFLKRCRYPKIDLDHLYVGGHVDIYSRQMRIVSYGDAFTAEKFKGLSQRTFCLIKPDGLKVFGNIVTKFQKNQLKMTCLSSVQLTRNQSKEFYSRFEKSDPTLYYKMCDFLCNGFCYAVELNGPNAIERCVEVCEDIRHKYGTNEIQDVCYVSDSSEQALRDLSFFFDEEKNCRFPTTARFHNTTLCLIKPHILLSSSMYYYGAIIQQIIDGGFEIEAIQMFHLNKTNTMDFLEVYKGVVPIYEKMVEEYSSGPIIAMEIAHSKAQKEGQIVDMFREFCGPLDPEVAKILKSKSIRALYGINQVQNAVHATDLEIDGNLEVEFFFKIMRS